MTLGKTALALAAVLAAASAGTPPLQAETAMQAPAMYKSTETAAYVVERSDGMVEIRRYDPRIIAEVTVTGSRTAAINTGFRVLAGFIFGGNTAKAKVAMTAPVAQSATEKIAMTSPVSQTGDANGWTVQFTMPAAYTMLTLPAPTDSRIKIVEHPGDRQVALQFSGMAGTEVLAAKEAELRAWALANGLTPGAGPHYYFYDAPFTLPWNRRNEVAFTLN